MYFWSPGVGLEQVGVALDGLPAILDRVLVAAIQPRRGGGQSFGQMAGGWGNKASPSEAPIDKMLSRSNQS
jgi:hypothetical protein